MTDDHYLWLILAACILLCFLAVFPACSVDRATQVDTPLENIIHVPPKGCPAGWRLAPDVFEYYGKSEPACIDARHPDRPPVTDYLRPQEGERFPLPPPKPKPESTKPSE